MQNNLAFALPPIHTFQIKLAKMLIIMKIVDLYSIDCVSLLICLEKLSFCSGLVCLFIEDLS